MRWFLKVAILTIVGLLLALAGLIFWHDFPVAYMDLNDDKFISPREMIRSLDLGYRTVGQADTSCVEIFTLRDGQAIKHICR
ncbi:hypothetical protein [Loktanella sp. Alg231-35]|uniref:hypothetical protein n=1 Tax=Loktanella sp. Alg231-35 TaxID=1922220 RepID=UPI000D558866|nr:hypothetical protein [Loktanella sp. Alg231-35]